MSALPISDARPAGDATLQPAPALRFSPPRGAIHLSPFCAVGVVAASAFQPVFALNQTSPFRRILTKSIAFLIGPQKPATRALSPLIASALAIVSLVPGPATQAANGIWIPDANGNWGAAANWTGGVPNTAGNIADFSTIDITANRTVNLNANRTAGTVIFGDTSGAQTWTVANGGTGAGNKLVLLGSSSTAGTIQVVNSTATISAILEATQGFAKTGTGTLALTNAGNLISNGIALNAGTLSFVSGALGVASPTNLITTGGNVALTWNGNTDDLSGRIKLGDGFTLTLNLSTVATDVTSFATALQTGTAGTGRIVKANASTLVITAANTYTGGTQVNNGRLILSGGDNRLSALGGFGFGSGANSGVVQLGDAVAASNQTITSLAITGTGTANAIVGGFTANSVLTINNTANIAVAASPIFGGSGTNENNLALIKSGAGSLSLSQSNTFTGNVDLVGGALILTNNNSLGGGSKTVTISGTTNAPSLQLSNASGLALASTISFVTSNDEATSSAIVNTAGNNVIGGSIALADAGFGGTQTRVKVNAGSLTLNGAIVAAATALTDRTLILDGAAIGTVNGLISDTGAIKTSVTKEGAGTWSLTAANAYTGSTIVSGGRLNLTTAQIGTGAITVGEGTTLGLTLAAAGQTLAPSALTLNRTSIGSALAFNLGAFSNPSVPVISTGVFTTAGAASNVIDIAGTGLSVGFFDLIQYTGVIGGAGFAGLDLGVKPARVSANLVDNSALSKVQLNISAFDVPKWTGATSGDWDVNDGGDPTTGTGTVNWKEANSGLATRYLQIGSTVDSVLFDDSATGTTTINLTTSLSPASVTINNATLAYTFGGSGKLTGATTLLKTGAGTLTVLNTGGNDYTGTTTINGGTLQVGDGTTLDAGQLGAGAIVLGNSGTLVLNRPTGVGQDSTLANVISGTGILAKQGGNSVTLTGNSSAFDGTVNVVAGVLKIGSANALGSTLGGTNVGTGGTLDITGFALAESVALNGGTLRHLSGASSLSSGLTLIGGGILDSAAGTLTLNGAITGSGGLTKNNAGNLVLSGASSFAGGFVTNGGAVTLSNTNTFSGGLAVNGGTVVVAANQGYTDGTTVGGGATLQIGASAAATVGSVLGDIALNATSGIATLNIQRTNSFNFTNNITSSGANATNAVIIGATGAGSVSGTVTLSGANTFTGNITINGGALRITDAAALGVGPKLIRIGSNAGPALKLDGSLAPITLAAGVDFAISSDGSIASAAANAGAIVNVAGDNVIEGRISQINGGGGNGRVFVEAGSLTIDGDIDAEGATGARSILLGGPALGVVNGVISDFNSAATTVVGVQKDGAGTWALNGLNTFTGAVTVQNGTLKISTIDSVTTNAQSLGAGASAVTLGTATTSGILDYVGTSAATLSRGLTVNGVGGGIVKNSSGQLLTLAGPLVKNGRPLTLLGGAFEVTGVISGASANSDLIVDGSTVTLSNASNTYNGPTKVIGGGTLKNGIDNAVPATSSTVILGEATNNTNGTFDLNGFNQTLTGLTAAGTGTHLVTNSAASGTSTLTHTGTSTFDGVIQDGATAKVAVTKSTGGAFILGGANSYTGATTVDGGALLVSGSLSGTIAVAVNAGGTLGGSGTITTGAAGNVTVANGGLLEPGTNSAGTLTLALGSGQLDVSAATAAAGWLRFELGTISDQIKLTTGTLNLGADFDLDDFQFIDAGSFGTGTYVLFDTPGAITGSRGPNLAGIILGYEATLSFANGNEDLVLTVGAAVPEPGAAVSLLGGIAVLLGLQRRRVRSSSRQTLRR